VSSQPIPTVMIKIGIAKLLLRSLIVDVPANLRKSWHTRNPCDSGQVALSLRDRIAVCKMNVEQTTGFPFAERQGDGLLIAILDDLFRIEVELFAFFFSRNSQWANDSETNMQSVGEVPDTLGDLRILNLPFFLREVARG